MQVQLNSLADTLPGAAAEAEQAILQAQVEGAISAAFSSLVDEQSCFMQEACQQPGGLTLLQHVSAGKEHASLVRTHVSVIAVRVCCCAPKTGVHVCARAG